MDQDAPIQHGITLLSRAALAKRLQTSPARVRKLVALGAIPPPIPGLNKFVWERVRAHLLAPEAAGRVEPELE